jgi:hypothetical protein
MEHSLHVLAVIATLLGLIAMCETGRVSWWLLAAVLALPFIRFEGVALAGVAILVMALAGHWRAAALAGVVIFAGLAIYVVVMQRLGLPFLPSSVLVKSRFAANVQGEMGVGALVHGFWTNFKMSMQNRWGTMLALTICALIPVAQDENGRWRSPRSPEILIALAVAIPLAAHIVAGPYEWFHRYEVYAVAIMVVGSVYFWGPAVFSFSRRHFAAFQVGLLAGLVILFEPYIEATVYTPTGARSIYEQMFQMHRFATEFFPRRVAVNDLGWTSYQNKNFVLDLWGLGSEPVRKLRAEGKFDAAQIEGMAKKYDVDYAMIYDEWFEGVVPKAWCRIAVLKTKPVTPAHADVVFYAVKPSAQEEMRKALDRFGASLPARVTLERLSCPKSP